MTLPPRKRCDRCGKRMASVRYDRWAKCCLCGVCWACVPRDRKSGLDKAGCEGK